MRKLLLCALIASALATAAETRLTNDFGGGYTSLYTLASGVAYTDAVISECSIARGRQNEPSVAMNPRNPLVLVGSSNDYCGVYAGSTGGVFVAAGPIWLGYYRSQKRREIVCEFTGPGVSGRYLALCETGRDSDIFFGGPGGHLG